MVNYIIVGCDLHDEKMVLKIAPNREEPQKAIFSNNVPGRKAMIRELEKRAASVGRAEIVFAYEASSLGFNLYDEMTAAGIRCYVLAPTRMERSSTHVRRKSDDRDAEKILEVLRGHLLAGNDLPAIWIPDPQTRDDRELVRARLDVGHKITALKTQIRTLLKRNGKKAPSELVGEGWTKKFLLWLTKLSVDGMLLPPGARSALASLLRQLRTLEGEMAILDKEIFELAQTPRYKKPVEEMTKERGVAILTAMVFLTEFGNMSRFKNRRQVGAFLGLVPSSSESGEKDDRKGHITHQGPWRLRKVLCQATWARVRREDSPDKAAYNRIARKNPKHKKIAVVACMRRLAIRLWHIALRTQQQARTFSLVGTSA